jgi:hypothetical protein
VPVESELRLSGIALLNQVDGPQYALTLKNVAVVPVAATILKATPPRYPPEMVRQDREGSVEMALTIGSDGRIKETRSITSTDPAFEAAVKESLKAENLPAAKIESMSRWRCQSRSGWPPIESLQLRPCSNAPHHGDRHGSRVKKAVLPKSRCWLRAFSNRKCVKRLT